MKLGFICNHNPLDKRAFSGTAYYMFDSLQNHPGCSIRLIGKHRRPRRLLDRIFSKKEGLGPLSARSFENLDAILSLVSTDLLLKVAQLTDVPIVHITDATPNFIQKFYGKEVSLEQNEAELCAIEIAKLVYYSSAFMMEQASLEFGQEFRPKMAAYPWGANLDIFPTAPIKKPPLTKIRLLFIGKDWTRKGGETAVETLCILRAQGISAELHLVGAEPEEARKVEGVFAHGYLNKNRKSHRVILERLLKESHFFLLPTRADCTPMVISEVNSYSIPALVSDVGGVGSLMNSGKNGEMFSLDARGKEYADWILSFSRNPEFYERLSHSSFDHYRSRLNWRAWADYTLTLLNEQLNCPHN